MKVTMEYPVKSQSGTRDRTTFMNFYQNICISRRWIMPDESAQQLTFAKISVNLQDIWHGANPDYKNDFKIYAKKFRFEKLKPWQFPPRSVNHFINLMYAWWESDPEHVDLETVTIADIIAADAPVITIEDSVMAKLLPKVSVWKTLSHRIQ